MIPGEPEEGVNIRKLRRVSMVQHLVSATQYEPLQKVPKGDASQGRSEDQRIKICNFYLQYSCAFDIDDGKKRRTK